MRATVAGDTDSYEVTYKNGSWDCECPFKQLYHPGSMCSHIAAVWLVWNAVRKGSEVNEQDTDGTDRSTDG